MAPLDAVVRKSFSALGVDVYEFEDMLVRIFEAKNWSPNWFMNYGARAIQEVFGYATVCHATYKGT